MPGVLLNRVTVFCLALVIGAGAAHANPLAALGKRLNGVVGRLQQLVRGKPSSSSGMIPEYVFEEIIRNTPVEGFGLSPEQRAANRRAVESAKSTLGLMRANAVKPSLLARATSALGRALGESCARGPGDLLNRQTCDCNYATQLPGTIELTESDDETAVDAARRGHTASKAFFALNKALGFDTMAVVDPGSPLITSVRYGHLDNAFYNGKQVVLGAGGEFFDDFSLAPDIQYHEIGHAMTEHVLTNSGATVRELVRVGSIDAKQQGKLTRGTTLGQLLRNIRAHLPSRGLNYRNQSGALNESISDIYGALGNMYMEKVKLGQITEAHWVLGTPIMSKIQGVPGHPAGIRNMLFPGLAYDDPRLGKDPQPDHMKNIFTGEKDNGGVHINSGIPNRAFALATMKVAQLMPDKTAWETTGYAWLHAMNLLGPNATFQEAADATYKTALQLFPESPAVAEAIKEGWTTVGLPPQSNGLGRKPGLVRSLRAALPF